MESVSATEEQKNPDSVFSKEIIVLDSNEKLILSNICESILKEDINIVGEISQKILNLQSLAKAMSAYPSIHRTSAVAGHVRSENTLIETMCKTSSDTSLLTFPTRSVLGKSFLVAKFHFFAFVLKVAKDFLLPNEELETIQNITRNIMFTIMAEDVYVAILESIEVSKPIKKSISIKLTELWEYRFDNNTEQFATVLTKVWKARDKIAPVFGTMLGTSELFLLSMELDEMWQKFMIAKMHVADIGMALEEFLFGISYENIIFLRKELRRKGIYSIGRDEVQRLLGKATQFESCDPRLFYASFSERRNNAIARKRLNIEGPKHTLEDYYIRFIFESIHESESSDLKCMQA